MRIGKYRKKSGKMQSYVIYTDYLTCIKIFIKRERNRRKYNEISEKIMSCSSTFRHGFRI